MCLTPRGRKDQRRSCWHAGNDFKGNTQNVLLPRGSTVDDVIEDAIFNAGGILLPNYRSKGLQRLKWSRSSRTDKGVSSLFTAVGLRMETPVRAHGGGSENESETSDDSNGSGSGSNSSLSKEEIDAEAKELIVRKSTNIYDGCGQSVRVLQGNKIIRCKTGGDFENVRVFIAAEMFAR